MVFRDGQGVCRHVEVTEPVFKAFDEFELEDLSRLNEMDNHLDRLVGVDAVYPSVENSTEAQAIERIHMEQLFDGMDNLTKTQRRRLKVHIFGELTYSQIAAREGCSITAVSMAITAAVKNLEKMTARP